MSVQININGDNADEAIRELSALASHLSPKQGAAAPAETPKSSRSRSTAAPAQNPVKEEAGDSKADSDTSTGSSSADGSDQSDDDAPIPTDVELRAKAQEVGKTPEKKLKIKALLDKFQSKNITELPEEHRAEFMRALEELA